MRKSLFLVALLFCATPAFAQKVTLPTGCSTVPANKVATSKDILKLTADIACDDRALPIATAQIAAHRKARADRLAALTPPVVTPAPMPPMPGSAVASPNGLSGEVDIADNFDSSSWLVAGETQIASADDVGAFRFTCLAGHVAYDDPIVYPGQPGKSHLHQFFGNTDTNANSTYQSLRTKGGSTCTRSEGESPQRSAYWMPAMLDGAGNVVKPDYMNTYYKQIPSTSPDCAKLQDPNTNAVIATGGKCIAIPNGLRFLMGYNMTTGANDFTNPNAREYWAMGYGCTNPITFEEIVHKTQSIADLVGKCPAGNWLRVFAGFPQCWDGKNLDSPDHRAHIAFPVQSYCPPTHPYKFSEVTLQVFFRTDANFAAGRWSLSADQMLPGKSAGSALHFDYWEGWSPSIKALWQKDCIDGHLSCANGNIGDGRQIRGMQQIGPYPVHVTVPIASIPGGMKM